MFKVGFYKMHPEIPSSMSERAKSFILRCFVADPDQRAAASDLLEEPFITDRKKKTHRSTDFSRSISVPERASKLDSKPERVERYSSTGEEGSDLGERRSSTSLLSPPIDSPQIDPDQGNFYVLKKDSQRRTFIVKVLLDNADLICDIWMNDLKQKTPPVVLTLDHLKVLLEGLREYIPEQNRVPVQQAISHLKEDVDFDGVAVNHMHLALYVFQDAVKAVLKQQNIMPHWVFSLDNLVRSSVQAAISILSPELGDNLEGKGYENELEETSTYGVSTANSTKSVPPIYVNAEIVQLQLKNESLVHENIRLMKELIATNEAYQELLKRSLEEKKMHVNLLELGVVPNRSISNMDGIDESLNNTVDHEAMSDENFEGLHEWLSAIGVDEASISKFAAEKYTYNDVTHLMTREDLHHLGLRGGIELRIWKHIMDYRSAA